MINTEVAQALPLAPPASAKTKADYTASSDYALTRAAARGEAEAFEELYRLHHRRVYTLCLRMTQNEAEAEDITQDVFIVLLHKAGDYRAEASFTTWLHRMTVNQVLMHFRRKKAKREEQAEDDAEETPAPRGTSGARGAQLVDRITLEDALSRLPPGYRAAFVLHDVEGYEHEEVARLLGCAVGTSKSQLHKARTKLRKILKGQR
ncbi:MAG TPA: RNA polymerase sigma factor [Pyrinomonadaceae bacterium]|jgi:RNA polymerase sigma-70 factor (ECF subfamily)|nr:RNA polymerase sigma factor [Pyrinomonadaceae bacterium]